MGWTNYTRQDRYAETYLAIPLYLALFLDVPDDNGGGTEATGGGYTRQQILYSVPVAGIGSNTNDIEFAAVGTNIGLVKGLAVFDALSGGNMVEWVDISNTPAFVRVGTSYKVPAGTWTVKVGWRA